MNVSSLSASTLESSSGSFDGVHPPSAERVADCVHCGFCLPSCPTYVLWGEETDSPRGRIHLVKMALEGEAPIDEVFRKHFDNCLGCMGCLSSCPSGVQYDLILEATRAQLERQVPRSRSDRWFRRLVLGLFPHRGLLRVAAVLAWWGRVSGAQALFRMLGGPRALPPRLRALEGLAPKVELGRSLRGLSDPVKVKAPRARVAMLEGCVQSVFFAGVNEATLKLLAAEKLEVVPVGGQGCCGALELHAGEAERARTRARALIERFESVEADYVVVNAAGCGSSMKTVDRLFDAGDPFRLRAEAFAARVRDVLELIDELGPKAKFRPLDRRVAYHDACHLSHAQRVRSAPRRLLRRIPDLQLLEVPDGELCCGSAGIYNLMSPEPATELGVKKAASVRVAAPELLAASNPGCLIQIGKYLEGDVRCVHPIELLAEQLDEG